MKRSPYTFLRGIALPFFLLGVAMTCCAQKWQRIGPEGGDVISLAAGGKGEVFLGTADGHVFASRDGGMNWELRGRVGKRGDGVVQALIADARGKTVLYAGVWTLDPAAGGGVYRSDDGGVNWKSLGLEGEAVRALAQSVSAPLVLVAGTRTGAFKTTDEGKNWTRISPPGDEELKNLDSIAIDPRDANVIYAGTYHLPWKTMDGGKSWKAVAAGMIDDSDVMSVEIDRSNPERIFASACSGIYRSENGGAQWTKLQGIPYASRRTQQILQDPANAAVWYAGTTEGLWRTSDAGENWTRVTSRDVVVNAMALPVGAGQLLIGTEADGIWMSRDGGNSFVAKNAGFSHRVLSGLAADRNDPAHLLVVTGGGNEILFESVNAGQSWEPMHGAPAGITELFSGEGGWFAALRGGGAARYDAKAKKWSEMRFVARTIPGKTRKRNAPQTARVLERIVKPEVLAMEIAGGRIFAATGDGLWSGGLREGKMLRLAEKEFTGKVSFVVKNAEGTEVYAAEKNLIARSTDGGKNWVKAAIPEKVGDVLWLRPENGAGRLLIVGARTGVYEASWGNENDWKLLQSGLAASASWPGWIEEGLWVIAMRAGGTYISRDGGHNWDRVNAEETDGVVSILGDKKSGVYAGTRTEGILRWGVEKQEKSQNGTGASSKTANN